MTQSTIPTATFERLRGRLFGLAYRMLGSRADAEDVVQEAYVRWHEAAHQGIDSPEAWLVTTTTRLAIDRLRRLKTEREAYVGPWLPEPIVSAAPPDRDARPGRRSVDRLPHAARAARARGARRVPAARRLRRRLRARSRR